MKIWHLHTSNQFGSPFMASEQDMKYYTDIFGKFYTKTPIQDWQPTMICGLHEVDLGKLLMVGKEFWVLTEKTKQLLAPLLNKSVEYLPAIPRQESHKKISRLKKLALKKTYQPILETVHEQQQYILNILDIKTMDIIDFEQSECEYNEESGAITLIKKLAFKPQLIKDSHLFKIDNPGTYFQSATFISDEFRKIIETNNLSGCQIIKQHESEGGSLVWTSEQE